MRVDLASIPGVEETFWTAVGGDVVSCASTEIALCEDNSMGAVGASRGGGDFALAAFALAGGASRRGADDVDLTAPRGPAVAKPGRRGTAPFCPGPAAVDPGGRAGGGTKPTGRGGTIPGRIEGLALPIAPRGPPIGRAGPFVIADERR